MVVSAARVRAQSCAGTQQIDDLCIGRKPSRRFLGEDDFTVGAHVEDAAASWKHLGRDAELLPKRSLQPGGLGQVVSTDAVFDGEMHKRPGLIFD